MKLRLAILLILVAPSCFAQAAQDDYLGRSDVSAPVLHPDIIPVSCSQATTVVTCTPTNFVSASQYYTNSQTGANLITDWNLTVSSPSLTFSIGTNTPMCVSDTGTAMDWTYSATDPDQGALHVAQSGTAVNTSTGAITLNSITSQTVSAHSGHIRPCMASTQTVRTPYGTGPQIVDPEGHWHWVLAGAQDCITGCSNSGVTPNNQFHLNLVSKYGTDCAAAKFETVDLKAANMAAHGEDSDTILYLPAFNGCTGASYFDPLPSFGGVTLVPYTNDTMDDRNAASPQPPISINQTLDRNLGQGQVRTMLDFAGTNFISYTGNYWPGKTAQHAWGTTAALACYMSTKCYINTGDDVDNNDVADSSQFWNNIPFQSTGADQGYIAAIAPLHVSYEATSQANLRPPFIFPGTSDQISYKVLSGSQPAGCYGPTAFTTPGGNPVGPTQPGCSWLDWARNWYQTVAAMNTDFGSTYTSFGTTETVVAAAVPAGCTNSCVGNGVLTVFSFSLNANVTPQSVHILVNPTALTAEMVAGDCPKVNSRCPNFVAETNAQGELHNQRAWAASSWYPVPASSTTEWCVPDSNNNIECVSAVGGGLSGQSSSAHPTWSAVGANTTDGAGGTTITWTNYDSAIVAGSGSFCNYLTGACQITFNNALATGTTITVSYTTGGWGLCAVGGTSGTGLADEDGCSANGGTAVVGTNSAALYQPVKWQASHAYGFSDDIYPNPGIICDGAGDGCGGAGATDLWIMQMNPAGCTSGSGGQPSFSATPATELDEGTGPCKWVTIGTPNAGTGGTYPAPSANQHFAIVAGLWENYEVPYFYYHQMLPLLNDMFPSQMVFLPNSFQLPIRGGAVKVAAQQGMAGAPINGAYLNTATDPLTYWKLYAIAARFKGPLMIETYYQLAQAASPGGCANTSAQNCPQPSTQANLASTWYTHVNNALNSASQTGGTFYVAALDEWAPMADIQNTGSAFLKSIADNRIDGTEDVATVNVSCANGVAGTPCGSETCGLNAGCTISASWTAGVSSWTGANGIVNADKLWLMTPLSSPSGPATKSIMMAKIDPAWIAAETHYTGGEKR